MTKPPFRLESDELLVELLPEHGARLHRIRAFGVDLLRTPPTTAVHASDPFFWGAYVMAPWCNRARPGPMEIAGRTIDLASNFPDGSAIHGQVYARHWAAGEEGWLSVTAGNDGWPWAYEVRLRPSLDRSTLSLNIALTNRSDEAMPAGIGLHPWFVRPVEVTLPASKVYRANTDSPPEPEPVDGTALDLRSGKAPPGGIDATWTALRDPTVRLRWPEARIEADLRIQTASGPCIAVATPSEPDATPVEPQTHGPDGLRRLLNGEPDAPTLLTPGEQLSLGVQLEVRRSG